MIQQNRILRKILLLLCSILSVINKIAPKNEKAILFYESTNHNISDNSQVLLDFLISNGYSKKYQIISSLLNKSSSTQKQYDVKTVFGYLKAVRYFLLSKYVFYSFGAIRIKPAKEQIVVNLWHGTPLKNILHLNDNADPLMKNENVDMFTYILSTTDFYKTIMTKAFNCDTCKIKAIGYPRNDCLFSNRNTLDFFCINSKMYKKKIIWMPTFRFSKDGRFHDSVATSQNETMLPLFETFEALKALNVYLERESILFVLKIHPEMNDIIFDYSNIKVLTNENFEQKNVILYEFIKDFDALLTDYSSVFFDFLLLDRPIGFIIDDLEEYRKGRGFVFENPLEYMPGHHIRDEKELFSFIHDIINDKDIYYKERYEANLLFNKFRDNKNCERLLQLCGIYQE